MPYHKTKDKLVYMMKRIYSKKSKCTIRYINEAPRHQSGMGPIYWVDILGATKPLRNY